jgi:D-alanyl-D-alanine carboxypeptidase (penicillin-binding protein 5/6)
MASLVLSLMAAPAGAAAPVPPAEIAAVPVTLLVDLGSGQVLQARQPDARFLPASMTKVMTAFVAFDEIAAGRLPLDRQFVVNSDTAREWSGRGTSLYVQGGQKLSADTLLHGIATASANDASVVLAEGYAGNVPAWTAMMNDAARRLGMSSSHYNTPNGWPDGGATYVSANDLVRLARAMITRYPKLYRHFFGQKRMTWQGATLQSHDPTVGVVPGADGIKTGYTREAGYNFLGSGERGGRRLVMVVAGAKSEAERVAASRALLEWGFSAWKARPLFAARTSIASAKVLNGAAREVPLVAHAPVYAVVPRHGDEAVSLRLSYNGPLIAPIAEGAQIAELEVRVGRMAPGRIPLFAGRMVETAGPFDRLINGLVRFFS